MPLTKKIVATASRGDPARRVISDLLQYTGKLVYRYTRTVPRVRQDEGGERERVTLATIAAELGVSRMTVSNAYNRPEKLSPGLRERVLATAQRLGYSGPDPLAATLSRGRVGAIGLIFDDPLTYAFTDPAAVLFFEGVAAVCEHERMGLALVPSRLGTPQETDLTRTALVDGFIAYCDVSDDTRLDVIEERGLPLVIADGPPREGAPWVGIDHRGAARAAAEHLLELGHRHIGIVALPLSPDGYEGPSNPERQATARYHTTSERLAGIRAAFEAAGIDWRAVPVEERAPHGRDAGRRAAAALLDRADRATALLAMSDELAIGALRAAEARGIAVPHHLSIIGFDDTPAASDVRPPLSTIAQPHREKGETAARMLLRPESQPDRVALPTTLVARDSTAPPGGC
jgi:DNA-binding LacI/PurR family transcriptional regulator